MAHFDYLNPPAGVWNDSDVPGGAAFTSLDQQLYKAINGDDGGTWAPLAVIDIGGLGLRGRIRASAISVGPNSSSNIDVATTRTIYLNATLTADRTYTLINTNALHGDIIEIIALPTLTAGVVVTVNNAAAAALVTLGAPGYGSGAEAYWAKFIYITNAWFLLSAGKPRNGILGIYGVGTSNTNVTGGAGWTDIGASQVIPNVKAGDKVWIAATGYVPIGTTRQIFVRGDVGGTSETFAYFGLDATATQYLPYASQAIIASPSSGSVTVKLQAQTNVTSTVYVQAFNIIHIRP